MCFKTYPNVLVMNSTSKYFRLNYFTVKIWDHFPHHPTDSTLPPELVVVVVAVVVAAAAATEDWGAPVVAAGGGSTTAWLSLSPGMP